MSKEEALLNEQIKFSQIRCISHNGEALGIIPTKEALDLARSNGLDLVVISMTANPPVCKIMNYGKYKYQGEKKQKEAKKKQKQIETKEIKFSTQIAQNDINYKIRHAREFLENGKYVKLRVFLRGREMSDPSGGFNVLARVMELVKDISKVDKDPKVEGRYVSVTMIPLKKPKDSTKEEPMNSIKINLTKGVKDAENEN